MQPDKGTVNRLIAEAVNALGADEIYSLALGHIDAAKMADMKGLTAAEIAANFSVAGFIAGIKYTLENIETQEE